ncbi:protein-L-isoaspartate(D-aspartate) O-methyltransferase [Candidatus Poribacteria bacterium]|nr:protein-L-isoaspartate(D-aspartate) O-methyltransferase [Candidatus Poribacteria bacterium]
MSIIDKHTTNRQKMVQLQIKNRNIHNPKILSVMEKIPRHLFVEPELRYRAYKDNPLPIEEGQTISQPYMVALMTDLLKLDDNSRVLEIGTGCGYQTAVLAEIAKEVYSIEILEKLADKAKTLLKSLKYNNIHLRQGNGYYGWIEHSPYDAVIVTAAPKTIPHRLTQQLVNGGRMVIPVGSDHQELVLINKLSGKIQSSRITAVSFVPMTGTPII